MKKTYLRFVLTILPIIILIGNYSCFYETKTTNEDSQISKMIENLPEYIKLSKENDGYVHIDFPKNPDSNFVNANILTFHLNGDPAKITYRLQYDKHLKQITSIKKEE